MSFQNESITECVGTVTVVTDDLVVFQGLLIRDEKVRGNSSSSSEEKSRRTMVQIEPEFIVLRLSCQPALIRSNAEIEVTEPELFEVGDVVKINVNEIIAIGPSRGCLGEEGTGTGTGTGKSNSKNK